MRWDFWERQAKKAFFWPVITMAEVDKYCLKNIVTFLLLSTIKKYNSNAYQTSTPETNFYVYKQKITIVGVFYRILNI